MGALARVGSGILAGALLGAGVPAQDPPPVDSGLTATVEVKLVTIDVVALDADDRTVPGLGKDDFQLFVDGTETPIDTLDPFCDGGGEADPAAKGIGDWATPANLDGGTRRLVLAFDYLHLTSTPCVGMFGGKEPCPYHTQSLQQFQDILAAKPEIADEEIMIVALTTGLRIEQPFTRDRKSVLETLRRMEHDLTLWNGNFGHLTEFPLFSGLEALMTVLRTVPGPKGLVFVSAGQGPGADYEPDFRRLAARASDAQVSIYSVDCQGIYFKRSDAFT